MKTQVLTEATDLDSITFPEWNVPYYMDKNILLQEVRTVLKEYEKSKMITLDGFCLVNNFEAMNLVIKPVFYPANDCLEFFCDVVTCIDDYSVRKKLRLYWLRQLVKKLEFELL
jgi:hypothetical protein